MLTTWRIVKRRLAPTAFDGEGARLFGGRWNSPGVPVVYVSETRALAMLEVLAGLGDSARLDTYVLISAAFDEALVTEVDPTRLPTGWSDHPPPPQTQLIGDVWTRGGDSVALRVPSALVPDEWNYVLNPRHPEFRQVRLGAPEALSLDPRLTR